MSGQEDQLRELAKRMHAAGGFKDLRQIQFTPPEVRDESYRKKIKKQRRSLARMIHTANGEKV